MLLLLSFEKHGGYPRGRTIKAAKNEKMIAADIPALVTSKIPVTIPTQPSLCSSDSAPCTSELPKLVIGTDAPAPMNLTRGSYRPNPSATAPATTSVLIVCAGCQLERVHHDLPDDAN